MKSLSKLLNESFQEVKPEDMSSLKQLCANCFVLSQNLRALHWNLVGRNFLKLHDKLGELYYKYSEYVDRIAERVRVLDNFAPGSVSGLLSMSTIEEFDDRDEVSEEYCYSLVLGNFDLMQTYLHKLQKSMGSEDEGTNALLSTLIVYIEKDIWLIKSQSK